VDRCVENDCARIDGMTDQPIELVITIDEPPGLWDILASFSGVVAVVLALAALWVSRRQRIAAEKAVDVWLAVRRWSIACCAVNLSWPSAMPSPPQFPGGFQRPGQGLAVSCRAAASSAWAAYATKRRALRPCRNAASGTLIPVEVARRPPGPVDFGPRCRVRCLVAVCSG
jgi:hypothetical protein